ncbi:DNA repair protein XRCC4-like [Phymastichus coffea]|uniref:DNA repair protein XRCC4-like n=1 Tax=Phymastichus coffea TaxID=108790 RepID=UPI00273B7298|nr:DNA repair protein XRCC4-like [Phymastichus coffea]XP_058801860.1 DNA repair protein XRCC4-like [Phymastichus coffea]
MKDIRVCKVLNKLDESNSENLIVCSIWEDAKLKVYIVKDDRTLLFGEEGEEQLEKYAKTFDKSLNMYLQESKDILCGIKSEIDFYLTESKFYWKREKWALGQIYIKPIQDIASAISLLLILIDEFSQNKKDLDDVHNKYQSVKLIQSEIIQKLNECQTIKNQLEDDLYKKFILILNSKKTMIKDLKDRLQKFKNSNNIFDELTNESDSDLEEKCNVSSHPIKKRDCQETICQKSSSKRKKGNRSTKIKIIENKNFKSNAFFNVSTSDNLEAEVVPSTSNNIKTVDEDEETGDLLSEESECDLVLKFDEDKLEDKIIKSAISEEDSEEMF